MDEVVQFMTPEALSVWIQRAGRAGQDGRPSRAILLVEPSVAKKLAAKPSKAQKRSKGAPKGGFYLPLLQKPLLLTSHHNRP